MGRTGVLGGTFDPIHLAHLAMGRIALREERLDKVLFMPSKIPPHKEGRKISPESVRRRMVELALEGEEGLYLSDFELRRQETTYTARTLSLLCREQPEEAFYFILGGDSLFYLHQWYRPEVIMRCATILAFARDGRSRQEMRKQADFLMRKYGGEIRILPMEPMEISSSEIRERLYRGESAEEYLPPRVHQFISEQGCYRSAHRPGK